MVVTCSLLVVACSLLVVACSVVTCSLLVVWTRLTSVRCCVSAICVAFTSGARRLYSGKRVGTPGSCALRAGRRQVTAGQKRPFGSPWSSDHRVAQFCGVAQPSRRRLLQACRTAMWISSWRRGLTSGRSGLRPGQHGLSTGLSNLLAWLASEVRAVSSLRRPSRSHLGTKPTNSRSVALTQRQRRSHVELK